MFKIILTLVVLFLIYFFGISQLRKLTGKEKWELTKLLGFSILCTSLTFVTISVFVLLF